MSILCFTFELNQCCITLRLLVACGPTLCLLSTLFTVQPFEEHLQWRSSTQCNSYDTEEGQSLHVKEACFFALVTNKKQPVFLLQPLPSPVTCMYTCTATLQQTPQCLSRLSRLGLNHLPLNVTIPHAAERETLQLMAWRPPRHTSDTRFDYHF